MASGAIGETDLEELNFQASDETAPPREASLTLGGYITQHVTMFISLWHLSEISSVPVVDQLVVPTLHWNVRSRRQGPDLHHS